jgi:curved DNA-binding protein CbpA
MTDKLNFIYDSETFIDLYNILNLDSEAKFDEIKSAYIKLAKIHHPDHDGNSELFQEITKAYEILYNKETRKEYDLYYLKKNINEYNNNNLLNFKAEFNNFINTNNKPISKKKLDEIYDDIFKDEREQFKEVKMEESEITRRINDINLERENINIECINEKLLKLITDFNEDNNTKLSISELFEYIKTKNFNEEENKKIKINEIGTLDVLDNAINYTSFISQDNDNFNSNLYSEIQDNNLDFTYENDLKIDDFNKWKNSKKVDKKLTSNEINDYLEKRKAEENEILAEIENNVNISTIKSKKL